MSIGWTSQQHKLFHPCPPTRRGARGASLLPEIDRAVFCSEELEIPDDRLEPSGVSWQLVYSLACLWDVGAELGKNTLRLLRHIHDRIR